jgi:hypothetical protein
MQSPDFQTPVPQKKKKKKKKQYYRGVQAGVQVRGSDTAYPVGVSPGY